MPEAAWKNYSHIFEFDIGGNGTAGGKLRISVKSSLKSP
jgi:hypothetical protein